MHPQLAPGMTSDPPFSTSHLKDTRRIYRQHVYFLLFPFKISYKSVFLFLLARPAVCYYCTNLQLVCLGLSHVLSCQCRRHLPPAPQWFPWFQRVQETSGFLLCPEQFCSCCIKLAKNWKSISVKEHIRTCYKNNKTEYTQEICLFHRFSFG